MRHYIIKRPAGMLDVGQMLLGAALLLIPVSIIYGWGHSVMLAGAILIIDVWVSIWSDQ